MYPDELVLSENESTATQETTLDRVGSRDSLCFDQMFEHYSPMVFNLAYRVLGNREEALDVSQEVFLTIFRKMSTFRGESSLKTWIYSIALHRTTNRYRWWNRLRRRGTVSLEEHLSRKPDQDYSMSLKSDIQSPEEALLIKEERERLIRWLQELPLQQRIPVILRDIEGLSYEEIAESMNVSLGTVKSRIARGREMLKRLVNGR
ncbi:MAG: sigma-70 family RNA polymerase sigma factor [Acidobacteriota bacterium]